MSLAELDLASAEMRIIREVRKYVGDWPLILCGSRAIGSALGDSDYDVAAVLPTRRLPRAVRALSLVSDRLTADLGIPVAVNPLPTFRLRHPGRTLFVWKLLREGRVLFPDDWRLPPAPPPVAPSPEGAYSYALSGLRYLISKLDPVDLTAPLPATPAHGVSKALLHVMQLRLLRRGGYASTPDDCADLLGRIEGDRWRTLIAHTERPATWFAARALLLPEVRKLGRGSTWALARNAQYLALSRRHGTVPFRALTEPQPIAHRFGTCVVHLANAIDETGSPRASEVGAAIMALPRWLRPAAPAWEEIRNLTDREWQAADPLVGL